MKPFVHDRWAALSHKADVGDGITRPTIVPTWVPEDDARRLAAYRLLAAYRDNVARNFLREGALPTRGEMVTLLGVGEISGDDGRADYREYGHAGLIVKQARAVVLGDEQSIEFPGLQDLPDVAEGQTPPPPTPEQEAADWLLDWAIRERLWLKMVSGERNAVGLGDAVYVLGWDSLRSRPRLRVRDPGFYFPDLSDDEDEYPGTVHLAWEEQTSDDEVELHRCTWRLGRINGQLDFSMDEPMPLFDERGRPVPLKGDTFDAKRGLITRRYPWQAAAEEPSAITCYLTHAVWPLNKVRGDVYTLSTEGARFVMGRDGVEQRDVDLLIDFVPVVHVPNDASGEEHFGESILTLIAQVLDDLSGSDTDLAETGRLVGSPPVIGKNTAGTPLDAGPGSRWDLAEDQSAELLDTSSALDALLKLDNHLKDTMSENSRISKALLGRLDGGNVPSGVALALSFGPTSDLAREMRQVRDEKYPLLLKFVMRMAQAYGRLPAGPTPDARVLFGSFLPTDLPSVVTAVAALLPAGGISTLTAVKMLVEAGMPIEDAEEEVARIYAEQMDKAIQLFDATGDEQLVLRRLGIKTDATGGAGGGAGGAGGGA